jgi:hypothetical protein
MCQVNDDDGLFCTNAFCKAALLHCCRMQGSSSYADWVLRHSLLGSWQVNFADCSSLILLQDARQQQLC